MEGDTSKCTEFAKTCRGFLASTSKRFDTRRGGPYHARAMGDPLRERQSLKTLAASRQVIEIANELGDFVRLAESVEREFAVLGAEALPPDWRTLPVNGRLRFVPTGRAVGGADVSARLEASVPAVCQRCLEPFNWPLRSTVELRVAIGDIDAVAGDDSDRELWELPGDGLRPVDMVDELLVMALPLSPRHEDTARCAAMAQTRTELDTTRPFARLRMQMDDAD